jgi:hypothetical protein
VQILSINNDKKEEIMFTKEEEMKVVESSKENYSNNLQVERDMSYEFINDDANVMDRFDLLKDLTLINCQQHYNLMKSVGFDEEVLF